MQLNNFLKTNEAKIHQKSNTHPNQPPIQLQYPTDLTTFASHPPNPCDGPSRNLKHKLSNLGLQPPRRLGRYSVQGEPEGLPISNLWPNHTSQMKLKISKGGQKAKLQLIFKDLHFQSLQQLQRALFSEAGTGLFPCNEFDGLNENTDLECEGDL